MRFITSQILSSSKLSLADAAKKEVGVTGTLDEILNKLDKSQTQVKTASSSGKEEKTAQCESCIAEEKNKVDPEIEPVIEELDPEDDVVVGLFNDPGEEPKLQLESEPKKKGLLASSKSKTMKVAKKADFRQWDAEETVKSWNQHSTIEKCIKNVQKLTNDPKTYCGLLQVASEEASKIIKSAQVKKEKNNTDNSFKKVAKLADKDKELLREYWTKLYGKDYVQAMLGDYTD